MIFEKTHSGTILGPFTTQTPPPKKKKKHRKQRKKNKIKNKNKKILWEKSNSVT